MASIPGDYAGRTKGTQAALNILGGGRVTPVHIPVGAHTNFEVASAGSWVQGWNLNVASTGVVVVSFANGTNGAPGDIIANCAAVGAYGQPFYCPWPVLVNTPGDSEDVTFYIAAPGKNTTVD